MAIVSFWSNGKEETAKTLSIVSIATNMAIEHNFKILVMSTNYNDDTLESCFWKKSENNRRQAIVASFGGPNAVHDIDSGIEGLAKNVRANRATPEIIRNYTKIVFKDRLEVLLSIKSKSYEEYLRLRSYYVEILQAANQYYDLVFVDLNKGFNDDFAESVLNISDLIISNITQKLTIIDDFMQIKKSNKIFQTDKNMLLIGRYDRFSKFNSKNLTRYLNEKQEIPTIPYNTLFFEACNDANVADFFLRFRLVDETDRNAFFIKEVNKAAEKIVYKLQELQMKM